MSAIVGIYCRDDNPAVAEQGETFMRVLSRFPAHDVQALRPDGGTFLGCHAQWITPESVGELNPLHDPERGLTVAADAILDNRDELCDLLGIDGGRRHAVTDTELLLAAYDAWGPGMADRLAGDFAFIIRDERRRQLYAARDFSGTRTLYFTRDPHSGTIWLCTVMEPLRGLPHLSGRLNRHWIGEYLAMPYTVDAVDERITVYEGIEQLPPSHYLIADAEGRLRVERYCRIEEPREKLRLRSDGEYVEAMRSVLREAVKSRIRTHRGVGAHLSGGLDSGSVASFAARELRSEGKPLYTFSYVPVSGFKDWTPRSRMADERANIRAVIEHAGNMIPSYCDFPERNSYTDIDDWLDVMEMPYKFFENSFWLKGIFELAAERDIAVMLNGQRGNWTISWGPALDYQAVLLKRLRFIRLYREMDGYARRVGTGRKWVLRSVWRKALGGSVAVQHPVMASPRLLEETGAAERLLREGFHIQGNVRGAYETRRRLFGRTYFWNLNGTYTTKLSLRYAVWDRDPTNDLRVIRFCLSVPEEQFVRNGMDRALIRRAAEGYLPDSVRLNQTVRGAQGADGVHRMRAIWPAFIREVQEMLDDEQMQEYLNRETLKESLLKIKDAPKPEYAYDLDFRILMRGLIFRRFIRLQERR